MSKELIIDSTQNGGRIALLHDKKLVELHYDNGENSYSVGDIYLGTIRKLVPGLNAAFVDIGYDKDAFLHYLDLGPRVKSLLKFIRQNNGRKDVHMRLNKFKMEAEIDKLGKITEVFKPNQRILVQIVKEPISTKGPRLSCELSIAGRYLVLVPFSNAINISKKISDQTERKRLSRLISSIKPENFGVIIRTVAEGKDVAELDKDLQGLLEKWSASVKALGSAKPRQKVLGELSKANSMLRDILNETFDSITVDDFKTYEEIREYIRTIAPNRERIVKHYSGKIKIFENFGIEKQLKALFGQTVSLQNGGYLVIEHTEAMHVIDVNSGNKSNAEADQESNALHVNLQAAAEIARQLRLRDMGGIIVIDFIDMKKTENKRKVYDFMKEEMKSDRSKYTILPLSKFGLMQITRQRVRPEVNIVTKEKCPTCSGTGKVGATITISDDIEQRLQFILEKQNEKKVSLLVHPYLFAHFTKGVLSKQIKWLMRYHKWVPIIQDSSLAITEYKFMNEREEIIEMIP